MAEKKRERGAEALRLRLRGLIIPTSLRIACVVIPLVVLGYILLLAELLAVFDARAQGQDTRRLSYVASQMAAIPKEQFLEGTADSLAGVAENLLAPYRQAQRVVGIEGQPEIRADALRAAAYYYRLEDGQYRLAAASAEEAQEPDAGLLALMERCAAEKKMTAEQFEGERSVLCVCAPVLDEAGGVLGAAVVSMDRTDMPPLLEARIVNVAAMLLVYFAALVALITAIITFSLRPLRRMTQAIRQFSSGETAVKTRVWGSQEVADILLMFNHLAENLDRYRRKTERIRAAYEPYVPQRMVRLLGRRDVRSVEPGDARSFEAGVLVLRARRAAGNGRAAAQGMAACGNMSAAAPAGAGPESAAEARDEAGGSFAELNSLLGVFSSAVQKNGGWIESFSDGGGRALFAQRQKATTAGEAQQGAGEPSFQKWTVQLGQDAMEGAQDAEERQTAVGTAKQQALPEAAQAAALRAAVRAAEQLRGKGAEVHAGLCHGTVRLRVVGTGQRMDVAADARALRVSGQLCSLAELFGATVLEAVEDGQYVSCGHARWLGRLRLTEGGALWVREVYAADSPEAVRLKDETRTLFEQGAAFFAAGRWREARDCFAQVLRANREDAAASRCFSLCDQRMEQGAGGENSAYLE